jgi:hypothetical protein
LNLSQFEFITIYRNLSQFEFIANRVYRNLNLSQFEFIANRVYRKEVI